MQKLIVLSVQVLFDSSRYLFVIWKLLKMYAIYIDFAVNIEYVDTFKGFWYNFIFSKRTVTIWFFECLDIAIPWFFVF